MLKIYKRIGRHLKCFQNFGKIEILKNKMILDQVKNKIKQILEVEDFVVGFNEIKKSSEFGYVYTNVAMRLKSDANVIADKIREDINRDEENFFTKIEVAGNGFINIWLSEEFLRNEIDLVVSDIKKGNFKIETKYTDKKVLVEHSSPNLFKPFHIGHLMNNIIGEFVSRSVKVSNANTTTISYPSDISFGIAKAIYIIKRDTENNTSKDYSKIENLGEAYVEGVKYFEDNKENLEKVKEIKDIANNLFNNTESEELDIYKKAKEINIEYFEDITKKIGSKFDNFLFESEAGVIGKKIVLENVDKVFTKSEGAIVYVPGEDRKDIHTSVFVNSEGNPTYLGKDIGLLELKFSKYNPEYSYTITDSEQASHFASVFAAASDIDESWKERAGKSHHVPHGRMTFKGAKMSSRLGGVPLALDTINAVIDEIKEKSDDRLSHLLDDQKEKVYFDIALSALRIAILRAKPGSNINFDPETSLSFEGDSGPYLQYTHARCFSLLEKGKESNFTPKINIDIAVSGLEIKLSQFIDVVKVSIEEIAPQKLVTYLFELAQEFNSYYANNQIIVEGDAVTNHRLYIVEETKNILKKGLYILGINAVERM